MTEVLVLPKELEQVATASGMQKAKEYAAIFAPFMMRVHKLSEKAAGINKDEPSATDAKIAREVRLAMVKNRTATAKQKDESKAALLSESNLIQNLHNVVISTSQMIEQELDEVEKFAERKEAAKIEAFRVDRSAKIAPYVEDASIFPLGTMAEDAFTSLLDGQRMAFDARKESERLAEEERVKAEAERIAEQKRIREENEKLRQEAEAKEKELAEERRKVAEEQAKKESEHNAKIAEIEKANKLAREKAQAEQDKIKAEANRLKREVELKKAEEEKERLRLDAEQKKYAKAPDKKRILSAIDLLPAFYIPDLKTKEAEAVLESIQSKFGAFKNWAKAQAENL